MLSNHKKLARGLLKQYSKIFAVLFISSALFSCSSTDDEDTSNLPAELTELNAKFEPRVLWEESVGDGSEHYFSRLKPAVAYDKVFSASRAGDVIAFDQKTGKTLWETDLSNVNGERSFWDSRVSALLSGGPVVALDKVFIGSENGKVYALDAATGKLVWQATIKGEVMSAPAVDSGMVVFNSASGILKAFNANTGEEVWKVEQDVPALTLRGISAPVIASGGVGNLQHLVDGVVEGKADAVLAASIFHFAEYSVPQAKAFMSEQGVNVRPV